MSKTKLKSVLDTKFAAAAKAYNAAFAHYNSLYKDGYSSKVEKDFIKAVTELEKALPLAKTAYKALADHAFGWTGKKPAWMGGDKWATLQEKRRDILSSLDSYNHQLAVMELHLDATFHAVM